MINKYNIFTYCNLNIVACTYTTVAIQLGDNIWTNIYDPFFVNRTFDIIGNKTLAAYIENPLNYIYTEDYV